VLKTIFEGLIADNDALGLFVFSRQIDEQDFIDLYNDFPRGDKVRMKHLVNALCAMGFCMVDEYKEILSSDDDLAIAQVEEELTAEEFDFVEEQI